jgi:hypothetical protein
MAARADETTMSWEIEGASFETCSCDVVGPCTASLELGADYDRRRVTLVFHVTSGDVDGADVSGLTVAAVTPRRSPRRSSALFSRQIGGPMQALGPHVSENLGVERAPIEVREEGLYHSVTIGDAVNFEIEDVVSFGVETGEPARLSGIFHPAGCELTVAKATRSSIDPFGIQYEGKAAFSSSHFTWAA